MLQNKIEIEAWDTKIHLLRYAIGSLHAVWPDIKIKSSPNVDE